MKKIVTITFSPTIDKSVSIKKMISESKMKCFNLEIFPGGGGINIARVLTRFSCDVTALFPANKTNTIFFKNYLHKEKVKYLIVECENEARESIEVFEEFSKKQFRLIMPNFFLNTDEWNACITALNQMECIEYIVVSGSFPENAPTTILKKLVKIAVAKNAKLVVDTSGDTLKNAIKVPLFLLKPNLEEFGNLIGIKNLKLKSIKDEATKFLNKYQCKILVISLGSKGAMLFTKTETHYIKAPKVKIRNTAGAGDSMLAGLLFGLQNEQNLVECLRLGVAFGTATTLKNGTELCSKIDVEILLRRVEL